MLTTTQSIANSTLLLVIDADVPDAGQLSKGAINNATVLMLDPEQDSFAQINTALQQHSSISSLHLVSHGRPGCITLGKHQLSSASLFDYTDQLQQWSKYLGEAAEIFLYGCEVAAGTVGQAFVNALSRLTGATIAASDDITGSAALGGDWELEVTTGVVRSGLAFTAETYANYAGTLALNFSKTDFVTGLAPSSISAGDLDGDGKVDLALANYDSNSVSVLLNNGTGGFSAKTDFAAGLSPRGLTTADLNGDGKLDLAVANYDSDNVSVLLNNGTGGFSPKIDFATGTGPRGLTTADLNGDGKLDLVVANRNANTISVLFGNGSGAFSPATNFATGARPVNVSVGDLNGDNKLDLVVANFSANTVSVLLGNGNGTFAAKTDFATGSRPGSVSIGDLNSDGKLDLVVANRSGNNVSVLLGNGNGTFAAKADFATGSRPASVSIGDFDGDGKLDLATANYDSGNVSFLLGNGDGTFAAKTDFAVGTRPASLSVKDFNGDGKLDLAVANYGSNNVSLLLNTASFAPTVTLPGQAIAYTENGAAILLDPTATVTDNSPNFNTGNLTVRFSNGGTAADRLTIVPGGNVALDGKIVKVGGTAIGTYTGGIGTENLVITLNGNATPAATQALLRQIGYLNTAEDVATSSRTIEVTINDGTGFNSTPVTKTVNVAAVNDAPIVGNSIVLYDGSKGTTLAQQNWTYLSVPTGVTPTASNGTTNLNSSSNSTFLAGFSRADQILDPNQGFVVSFSTEILSEAIEASADKNGDGKTDRAGFSIVVVSQDKTKAIELGFHKTASGLQIFAQEDGTSQIDPALQPTTTAPGNLRTLFTQAEAIDANLSGLVSYDLAISGSTYTLYANGNAILSGKLRNYSAFSGAFDPYETPNLIFFGDDTTSANANVNLGSVRVSTNTALADKTAQEDQPLAIPELFVDDWDAASANLTVTLSVANGTLTLNSANGATVTNSGSSTVTLTGNRSQINATLAAGNLTYQGKANFNGTDTLTVKAEDKGASGGAAQTTTKTMKITVTAVQDLPTTANNTVATVESTAYTFEAVDFKFADPDTTDSLQKVKIVQLPQVGTFTLNGISVNINDEIAVADISGLQFKPVDGATGENYANFQFQVSDGQAYSSSSTMTIRVVAVNDPPTISGTPTTSVAEDSSYSFKPVANDPDGGKLTFDIANKPVWATFNAATGELSGTPINENVGVYSDIVISVSDGIDTTELPAFTLTVTDTNDAPTLATPITDQVTKTGGTFNFVVPAGTFQDIDATDTLTLSAALEAGSLPSWLQFDVATGTFSGTPTSRDVGNLNLKVTATDKSGASISDVFVLTVQDATQPTNPEQPGQPTQPGQPGQPTNPEQPTNPGQPTNPQQPGQPTDPTNPSVLEGIMGTPTAMIQITQKMQIRLRGTQKADKLRGGLLTKDLLYGSGGDDRISGGIGRAKARQDRLYGEAGNDQLFGGNGIDLLDGGEGNDQLFGGTGRDLLLGKSGDDRLLGEKGEDILIGGQGRDTLTGGKDKDMFVFDSLDEAQDVITDFDINQDVIDLRKIFAAPAFSGSTPFARFKQFVRLEQVGSATAVKIDADGNGSNADFVTLVSLNGVSTDSSSHFVIA